MNITQLTYFKSVVEEMSVTKAAHKLYVTQSAVSQQIRLLAEELDCQLFYRRGRALQLTLDGEFLYQRAKTIISQMDGLADELKSRGEQVVGSVKIGIGPVTSKKLLPEVVASMVNHYPEVSFSLFEIHSRSLVRSIAESRIDLGLGQINEDDPQVFSDKLLTGRLVLVCSSQNKYSSKKSISIEELSKLNLIHRVQEVENIYHRNILQPRRSRNFQLEAMNTETIMPYVQLNMGMTLAPNYIVDMMNPKGICQIELEKEIPIAWGVMRDRYRPLSKAAQVFIEHLKQKLQATKSVFQDG